MGAAFSPATWLKMGLMGVGLTTEKLLYAGWAGDRRGKTGGLRAGAENRSERGRSGAAVRERLTGWAGWTGWKRLLSPSSSRRTSGRRQRLRAPVFESTIGGSGAAAALKAGMITELVSVSIFRTLMGLCQSRVCDRVFALLEEAQSRLSIRIS